MADFGISGFEPSISVTRVCGCYLVHLQWGKVQVEDRTMNRSASPLESVQVSVIVRETLQLMSLVFRFSGSDVVCFDNNESSPYNSGSVWKLCEDEHHNQGRATDPGSNRHTGLMQTQYNNNKELCSVWWGKLKICTLMA